MKIVQAKQLIGGLWIMLTFFGCQGGPDIQAVVHESAPMPNGGRACATCFVLNDQAYIFAGRDAEGEYLNDLWRYTPATDTWEDLGTTPLSPRVNATACVYNGKAYIGLGYCGKYGNDTSYLSDWWVFTPATMSWERLQNYPNSYTDDVTAFVDDDKLFVGYGFCWNYRRDMFCYTIGTNRWDSVDVHVPFHGYPVRSFGGTGSTCQHRHFMGTGYYRHSLNWWAEFLPEGRWEKRAVVPGKTRTLASSAATANYIYLSGGLHYGGANTSGEVLQDLRRYDPQKDTWQWVAVMPKRLMNHISFAVEKKLFFGLGEDEDYIINDQLYYIEE